MMKRLFDRGFSIAGLVLCLALVQSTQIFAAEKPLLSEAIANAIDTVGVAAAIKQFASNYERDKDRYIVDMEGISNLGSKYAKAQSFEAAGAVMQITSPYMAQLTAGTPNAFAAATVQNMEEARRRQLAIKTQRIITGRCAIRAMKTATIIITTG